MVVLDKFRGGRELVPGRELVHHHYNTNQNHEKHCLSLFCCLVSAILLFTLFKFDNFEDCLSS